MITRPVVELVNGKKMWLMPDGCYVPYIAGGSNSGDNGGDSGGDGDGKSGVNNEGDGVDVGDYKSKYETEKSKTLDARKDAAKYREKLRALEDRLSGVDIDSLDEIIKSKQDEDLHNAAKTGDFDKLLKERTKTLSSDIDKHKEEARKWRLMYESKVVGDAITSEASGKGAVNPEDVKQLIYGKYKLTVGDSGDIEIKIGDELATDGEGNKLTIQGAVSSILEDRPYMVKSANPGIGANKGTRSNTDGLTRAEKIASGLKKMGVGS